MIYFISGHRDITEKEFSDYYIPAIYSAYYKKDFEGFIMGDYEGVDKMAMDYVTKHLPCGLTVYHMFDTPRNKPENDSKVNYIGNYMTDEERDFAMTMSSDVDIAYIRKDRWDSGTAQNIKRRYSFN